MFRNLILVMVIYPLLMPPGVCTCGAVWSEGGESQPCYGRSADTSLATRYEWARPNSRARHGGHGVPTGDQCPPNCPANQKTDHSKLVEQSSVLAVWAAAIGPLSFDVDRSSGQHVRTADSLLRPSAQPLYITLCTLVI